MGNDKKENLMDMIRLIEKSIGKQAIIKFENLQPGDVKSTHACINYSKNKLGYSPKVEIENGIPNFIEWYLKYKKK